VALLDRAVRDAERQRAVSSHPAEMAMGGRGSRMCTVRWPWCAPVRRSQPTCALGDSARTRCPSGLVRLPAGSLDDARTALTNW